MRPRTALVVRGISKSFGGVKVLDDVSLEVYPGEVLCLAGENGSGKSTLIKIIAGVVEPDEGEIQIGTKVYRSISPIEAIAAGVEVIYQDLSLLPNLTVAENIALPSVVASRRRLIDRKLVRRLAAETTARIGAEIDLDARVEELEIADRQLTAICRAIASEARILFLDEPTTALTRREVQRLFAVVRELKSAGVASVFVSHKLNEIAEIAERITIVRDGRLVAQGLMQDFDRTRIVRAMTGRDVSDERYAWSGDVTSTPVVSVRKLGLAGAFTGIDFELRAGEILGITGLLGSGRAELAEALAGIRPADVGWIEVVGRKTRIASVQEAIEAGFAYVPDDRLGKGLFLDHSIARNLVAGTLGRYANALGWLQASRMAAAVRRWISDLKIKTSSAELPVHSLSGGNQQRVLLAKWLAASPRVLILSGPTVGVDVGSKHEILELVRGLARGGMAILIFSDDIPELTQVCNRVLIMHAGRIREQLSGDELDDDRIASLLMA